MSASSSIRRAIAEIDFGEGETALFKIGNRSIHQFWHLFSAHFRHVLLAPQRRPDSGRVAWNWREAIEKPPVTATELAEVRRRLTEANLSLEGGFGGLSRDEGVPGGGANLEAQVRANVREMVAQLIAMRDFTLATYVCRTDGGLMVHSWGAPVAAQPHFPDAQNGEISGTLFAGSEHPAGASVVLENETGGNVARTRSDKDGGFRFPSIPPGTYRVRVADRSDFPLQGLMVTMERESITGLELRRDSIEPISIAPSTTPAADNETPWYKRTAVIGFLALLFLATAGGWFWRMQRDKNAPQAAKNNSADWQSADGQVGVADPKNTAVDERKVGPDSAWSSLSKTIPAPKISVPHRSASSSGTAVHEREGAGHLPVDSAPAEPGSHETKSQAGDTTHKSKLEDKYALPPKPDRPAASLISGGKEKLPLEETSGSAQDGEASKPAENKLASVSKETGENKKERRASAGLESEDARAAPDALSSGLDSSSAEAKAEEAKGESSQAKKLAAQSKKQNPSAPNAQSSSPAPEEASSDSAKANPAEPSTNQLKVNAGQKPKKKSDSSTSSSDSSLPPESSTSNSKADNATESPPAESAPEKDEKKPASAKKETVKPKSAMSEPKLENHPKGDDSLGKNEEPEKASLAAKNSPAAQFKNEKAAARPASNSQASATSPEREAGTETDADSSASGEKSSSSGAAKKPAGKNAAVSPSAAEKEESASNSTEEKSASIVLSVPSRSEGLAQIAQIRTTAWKPRLTQDRILPTRPVTAAEEEALEHLRAQSLKEKTAQMPQAFQQPWITVGVSFEIQPALGAENNLRWEDVAGKQPTEASIHGDWAELAWSADAAANGREYILKSGDRDVARISVNASGALSVKAASDARAWYWVGIEHSSLGGNATSRVANGSKFEWRSLTGIVLPEVWPRDDQWREGRGQRLSIPLNSSAAVRGNYGIAIVDRATGWALVSDVALR